MKKTIVMLTLGLGLSLVGCANEPPMGQAKRQLIQAQTLDPEAGQLAVSAANPVPGRQVERAVADLGTPKAVGTSGTSMGSVLK
ncbi:hypothetical protein [uncultured Cohaesibacter sp.]|uniref:hypothetical protein n=1 Tax=uncultured Cohaesibacter sp. TaxID=1002546 RepID=UPI0029C72DE9|nr:hypothetical protein [uncultured Cohaesibacter sp.]